MFFWQSSSSILDFSPSPVCFYYAASRFPQCSAKFTTKMAEAMEEYEKEAGCVPILHPEVRLLYSMSTHKHVNVQLTRLSPSACGRVPVFLRCCFRGGTRMPLCFLAIGGVRQLAKLMGLTLAPHRPHRLLLHSRQAFGRCSWLLSLSSVVFALRVTPWCISTRLSAAQSSH